MSPFRKSSRLARTRTPAERERERLEREARRAGSDSHAASSASPVEDVVAPEELVQPEGEAQPAPAKREAPADTQPQERDAVAPDPAVPQAATLELPTASAATPGAVTPEPVAPEPPAPTRSPPPGVPTSKLAPPPRDRVMSADSPPGRAKPVRAPVAESLPAPPTWPPEKRSRRPRLGALVHGPGPARQRTRAPRRRLYLGALLVAVLVAAVAWFAVSLFQPFTGSGTGRVVVDVPHGAGASRIGSLLASKGVVASGFFFNLRAKLEGSGGDLDSGVYPMRHGMSYAAALAQLSKPPPPPPVVKVVIPEGDARATIAKLARADGLHGSYLTASEHSALLDPAGYGAPASTPNLEGFLFPATYPLKVGASVSQLVSEQLVAFKQNFGAKEVAAARKLHVTAYGLLTVASMIEREALLPGDRAKVGAVIYNRLRSGMPLGIDATLRYLLNNWTTPLTEADLRISSPYNTRTHRGLPPTPIGNPGLAAIHAAAHPAHVGYLYYVAGADGCGELVFSSSYTRFQADAAAYNAAIAHNGGRVPTCHR